MASASTHSILIVEDEPQLRAYLMDVLSEEGFNVLEAGDAPLAFEILKNSQALSLVITDVRIPGYVSGTMFAQVVAEYRPSLPIIVMSGYAAPRLGEMPANAVFLPKPFTSSRLLQLIGQRIAAA